MNAATKLPVDIGAIHFVGIGGIGMSGIAEVLVNLGYTVQGSRPEGVQDHRPTGRSGRAASSKGNGPRTSTGPQWLSCPSAIKPGNPELDEARKRGLPVVRRADMLAELMRLKSNIAIAGTHGKTTTTTMMAELMVAEGGFDPTVINGGIIHAYGSNARMGRGRMDGGRGGRKRRQLPASARAPSRLSPISTPNIWNTGAISTRLRQRLSGLRLKYPVLRSLPSAAPIMQRCKRLVGQGHGPACR